MGEAVDRWRKISLAWRFRLWRKNRSTKLPRIGFGPIVSGEHDLANRKWEIDPIVNYINEHSDEFRADVYFPGNRLDAFAAIVIVKNHFYFPEDRLRTLRERGVKVFFNTSDNIIFEHNYRTETAFLNQMDGVIAESPLTVEDLKGRCDNVRPITTPLINRRHKQDYRTKGPIRIFWEGHLKNVVVENRLNAIVRSLAAESKREIRLIYHVNGPAHRDGIVEKIPWKLSRWEALRLTADIAIEIKDPDCPIKQRKPAAKVQTYMATGLPVVCTPSAADRLCIDDGKTGFFATTDDEWHDRLKRLIEDASLREKIGRAARESILKQADIGVVGEQYLRFFKDSGVGKS